MAFLYSFFGLHTKEISSRGAGALFLMPHRANSHLKTTRRFLRRMFRAPSRRSIGASLVVAVLVANFVAPLASYATGGPLSVTLGVDKEQALRGDTLSYTGTIRNTGTTTQNAVYAVLQLQGAGDYVNGSGTYMHSETGNTLPLPNAWLNDGANFGYVLAGHSVTVKFRVRVRDDAPLQQYVQVTLNASSREAPSVRRATVSTLIVEPSRPQLAAEQYADRVEASPGDTIRYTIRMKNTGNVVLHNLYIVEYLPNLDARFVDYVPGSGSITLGGSVQQLADRWVDDGARINYLNPGQEAFVKFEAKVRDSAPNGQVLFSVANIRSDEMPQWIQCSVRTTVRNIPPPQQNPPRLTVIKHVVNNDGGVKQAGDFTLEVSGSAGNRAVRGSESGLELILAPGSYTVSELPVAGYRTSTSSGCSGTLANSDVKVCVVTNDDVANPPQPNPPRLTLIKHVVNNDGGTRVAANFMLTVSVTAGNRTVSGSESGTELTLSPGSYTVTETPVEGYTATMSSGCAGTLADGDVKVCIVTNDDNPAPPANPRLTVIKHVVNNDGGTKQAGNFTIRIQGSAGTRSFAGSEAGVTFELQPGTYTVAEDQDAGYLPSLSTDCAGALTAGQTKVCVVTNDDKPAPPPSSPSLTITKDVLQSFTNPDTVVSYRIAVRNVGAGIAQQVRVEDQLPAGFTHTVNSATTFSWALGDLSSGQESVLTYTVRVGGGVSAGFYTNTASASATNHGTVSDTATLEVRTPTVIGESTKPNLVLAKTANVSFVNPGGIVTYHLVLENRGDGVAENVVVTDTLPAGFTVSGTSPAALTWNVGDLVPGARWEMSFSARVSENIPADTYRNVVVAKADNHGSVEASAQVEVRRGEVLGISILPATGGSIGAIVALAVRVLGSLAAMIVGLVLAVDPSGRLRRRHNPETRLLFLVARA
ncbi:MAG: DUF11 domain-containing protein, partial [Candidatus Terrybacteria bacterium]|nr:DUF11 domain-containing protein [Candidatus Terrybacteria bacterium]